MTKLTDSSRCNSRYAENSTRRNLCVAIDRPSHGGVGDACILDSMTDETAVAGFPVG